MAVDPREAAMDAYELRISWWSVTILCPVCNGEGERPIFAYDGTQTNYTVRCPHCAGFGRVGREP